jgi:hypothetical protein
VAPDDDSTAVRNGDRPVGALARRLRRDAENDAGHVDGQKLSDGSAPSSATAMSDARAALAKQVERLSWRLQQLEDAVAPSASQKASKASQDSPLPRPPTSGKATAAEHASENSGTASSHDDAAEAEGLRPAA